MPASITDKISKVTSGVRPVSTTVGTLRNIAATTLACADLTGWTTTEIVFFVTYKLDGQGNIVAGSQSDWKGIVSGTNINNLTLTGGADAGNAPGDIVEMLPTAEYAKALAENVLAHANQDGTLKSATVTTALTGTTLPNNTVATTSITNGSVTGVKLGAIYGAVVTRSAVLSLPNNASTEITWNSETYDNSGFFSGSSTDVVIPVGGGGMYSLSLYIETVSAGTGIRSYQIKVGTTTVASDSFTASDDPNGKGRSSVTTTLPLVAGNIVTASVFHNHGAAINLETTSYLSVIKMGTV